MDYKKKYKDALEKARSIYNNPNASNARIKIIDGIFPELAESEKIRKEIIFHFQDTLDVCTGKNADLVKKWISWLEKQGEQKHQYKSRPRYVGEHELLGNRDEQKPEWSEKDDIMKNRAINLIKPLKQLGSQTNAYIDYKNEVIDWLKSLSPQKQWKPSEEQIKTLGCVIDRLYSNQFSERVFLRDLYEQLKAL